MGKKKQDAPRNNHVSTVPKKTVKAKLKKKECEDEILQPFGSFGNHSRGYIALAILLGTLCWGINL